MSLALRVMSSVKALDYIILAGLSIVAVGIMQVATIFLAFVLPFDHSVVHLAQRANDPNRETLTNGNIFAHRLSIENGYPNFTFVNRHPPSNNDIECYRNTLRTIFGFPVPLMYYETVLTETNGGSREIVLKGGWRISRGSDLNKLPIIIPYYFIPVNVAFAISMAFLILLTCKLSYLIRHDCKGLCIKCAYPMCASGVCPECGYIRQNVNRRQNL